VPETSSPLVAEVIHEEQTVTLRRELHEVTTADGMRLLLTRRLPADGPRRPLPLLLVHGFGQNRFTWALARRSLPARLVAAGYEVAVAELRGHGQSRRAGSLPARSLQDYTDQDLPALLDYLLQLTRAERLILVAHSLGGLVSLGVPPARRAPIAGIAALATPGTSLSGSPAMRSLALLLRLLLGRRSRPGGGGAVFPLDRIGQGLERVLPLVDRPGGRLLPQMWLPGSIEPDLLRELLREGFEQEGLPILVALARWLSSPGSVWAAEPELVRRVTSLALPVLLLAGDRDALAPPDSVEGWTSLLSAADCTYRVCGGEPVGDHFGHLDMLTGTLAPEGVWPHLLDWLEQFG